MPPVKDVDTHILVWVALHLIKNAINAITKGISLPSAGNPKQIGDQVTYIIDLVLEAGQEDQLPDQTVEGAIDLRAEEDNPTEVLAVTEVAATVEVLHKTATTEDLQDVADTVQHYIDIRSATLPHL